MSEQACDFCGKLFRDGDTVEAKVLTRFKALKSKRIYAIEQPFDCLSLRHMDCINTREGD